MRLFSNVWSENTALLERLMEIHSNAPKLYYGFKGKRRQRRCLTEKHTLSTLFFGHGCVASHVASEPPPPPLGSLHGNSLFFDILVPPLCVG